jgi:hypothetical protein
MKRELNNRPANSSRHFKNLRIAVWHIVGITIIIGFQIVAMGGIGAKVTTKGWLTYLLQVVTFYANFLFIVPLWYHKRKLATLFSRLLLLISLHILTRGWIIYGSFWQVGYIAFVTSAVQLILASLQLAIVLGLSFFLGLHDLSVKRREQISVAQQKAQEALEEKLRIECIMSQLQLSPHSLFNSLNYIKVRSENVLPDVGNITDLVADILRHTLIDISIIKMVLLSAEVDLVDKYIQLHKQLSTFHPYIDFTHFSNCTESDLEIPPSVLFTLTENVLKYSVLNDPDTPAKIQMHVEGNILFFHAFNYKRGFPLPGRGRGLNSVRTILRYYYPEKHNLTIDETEQTFSLKLTINL